jgi:dihydrofolate reductase
MKRSLIVAMDEAGLIGRDGDLPWRLPNDLRHFRKLTMGGIVLMGRKTWVSLGKPLEGRENWVLSRGDVQLPDGVRHFRTLEAALQAAGERKLMVIGGAQIYAQALPHMDALYLTRVHAQVDGDTWFPDLALEGWKEIEREEHAADERHAHAYTFLTLVRA